MTEEKIAIIRLKGERGLNQKIKSTLYMLRLAKKNNCVVLPKTKNVMGMIIKVKDFVTWGEISEEVHKMLMEKRSDVFQGREADKKKKIGYNNKFIVYNNKKIKPVFRLHPPVKGFERKGIKASFNVGGALGYRKEKINDLIKRMI